MPIILDNLELPDCRRAALNIFEDVNKKLRMVVLTVWADDDVVGSALDAFQYWQGSATRAGFSAKGGIIAKFISD